MTVHELGPYAQATVVELHVLQLAASLTERLQIGQLGSYRFGRTPGELGSREQHRQDRASEALFHPPHLLDSGIKRPILPAKVSVNQMLWSAPTVSAYGAAALVGIG